MTFLQIIYSVNRCCLNPHFTFPRHSVESFQLPSAKKYMSNSIVVKVYLNQEYDNDGDLDITNDVVIFVDLDRADANIQNLKDKISATFQATERDKFGVLFANYEWKLYSYTSKCEIEDDDDLETEIDEFFPSDSSDDDDTNHILIVDVEYLNLRVIFNKTSKFNISNIYFHITATR